VTAVLLLITDDNERSRHSSCALFVREVTNQRCLVSFPLVSLAREHSSEAS
jgi:hypothetical protein